jgi:hypothetical protein
MAHPKRGRTFFSTVFDRDCSGYAARDIFVTEDVVAVFKQAGLKGGVFDRMLTDAEEVKVKGATGKVRWPSHAKVYL